VRGGLVVPGGLQGQLWGKCATVVTSLATVVQPNFNCGCTTERGGGEWANFATVAMPSNYRWTTCGPTICAPAVKVSWCNIS